MLSLYKNVASLLALLALTFAVSACTDFYGEFNDQYKDSFADDGKGYEDFDLAIPKGLGSEYACRIKKTSTGALVEVEQPPLMYTVYEWYTENGSAYEQMTMYFLKDYVGDVDSLCAEFSRHSGIVSGSFKCGSKGVATTEQSGLTKDEFLEGIHTLCDATDSQYSSSSVGGSSAGSSSSSAEILSSSVYGSEGVYEDDYTVTDLRDGHEYYKTKIGSQVWMTENMKYNPAGAVTYCYNDDEVYCSMRYGRLYSWSAAQQACPTGWHLPSKDEWDTLYLFIERDKGDSTLIGPALKSEYSWEENGGGTDDYNFSAWAAGVYTGYIKETGKPGVVNKGYVATFWTSTMSTRSDSGVGYGMVLMFNDNLLYWEDDFNEANALSVRCIKD